MSDLLFKRNLCSFISHRCKPPDHSLLSVNIKCSYIDKGDCGNVDKMLNDTIPSKPIHNRTQNRRYNFNNMPESCMNSSVWRQSILAQIESLESCIKNQDSIDVLYKKFSEVVFAELDLYFKAKNTSKSTKRQYRHNKPYWSEDLKTLWENMRDAENCFLKQSKTNCSNKKLRDQLRADYIKKRHIFDKALRQAERKYNQGVLTDIEKVNTQNPRAFWDYIKKLGPRKNNTIPMKVKINDTMTINENDVLKKWQEDFSSLYNIPDDMEYDDLFKKRKTEEKFILENYPQNINEFINQPISFQEVEQVINSLKINKACGFDGIPNEVVKNKDVVLYLWKFFNLLFNNNLMPSIWLKAIITPIPKGAKCDPHVPLNYRGISLLSCVSKAYSGIINKRITRYLDDTNFLVDEQNGFRKDRSCEEHIFSLHSMIQTNIKSKKSVFGAFIDLEKAFDWVDRDLLFYKLLHNNINGNIYNAIKLLYTNTLSCMKINNLYTDWFQIFNGVRQGDTLSPTLFSFFINDLASELKELGLGIDINGTKICILLYADDMVLIANSEAELQSMLNVMYQWCKNGV